MIYRNKKMKNRNLLVSLIVLLFFTFNLTGCASTPNKFTGYINNIKMEEPQSNGASSGRMVGSIVGAATGVAAYLMITNGVALIDWSGTGMIIHLFGVGVGGLIWCAGVLIGWLVDQGSNPPKHKESTMYYEDPILINGEQW